MKNKKVIIIIAAVLIFVAGVATGIIMHSHNKAPADKTMSSESDNTENTEDPSENAPTFERSLISDDTLKSGKAKLVEATDSDFEILGTDVNDYDSFIFKVCNLFYEGFDCKTFSTGDIFERIIGFTGDNGFYSVYFDEETTVLQGGPCDPQKKFEGEPRSEDWPLRYHTYSADNLNWIIKNIFNVNPEVVTDFNEVIYQKPLPYYYEGRYYFNHHVGGDGATYVKLKEGSQKRLSDGTYSVVLDSEYGDYANAIVGLKEINGQKFWSLYKLELVFDEQ